MVAQGYPIIGKPGALSVYPGYVVAIKSGSAPNILWRVTGPLIRLAGFPVGFIGLSGDRIIRLLSGTSLKHSAPAYLLDSVHRFLGLNLLASLPFCFSIRTRYQRLIGQKTLHIKLCKKMG